METILFLISRFKLSHQFEARRSRLLISMEIQLVRLSRKFHSKMRMLKTATSLLLGLVTIPLWLEEFLKSELGGQRFRQCIHCTILNGSQSLEALDSIDQAKRTKLQELVESEDLQAMLSVKMAKLKKFQKMQMLHLKVAMVHL